MIRIDKSFALFEAAMRGIESSHRVTAHNIANISTPGYKTREVDFEEELASAIDSGGDLESAAFPTRLAEGLPVKANGNNVALEREWMNLESIRLKHDLLWRAAGGTVRNLLNAIRSR